MKAEWFERLLLPVSILMGLALGGAFAYALSMAKGAGG